MYGKLEEPDGLAGLAKLRSGGPLLSDQLLAAEKAGSWSEALGLHEQVASPDCTAVSTCCSAFTNVTVASLLLCVLFLHRFRWYLPSQITPRPSALAC